MPSELIFDRVESQSFFSHPSILVIAEDDSLRELLTLFLHTEGYGHVFAANGIAQAIHHLSLIEPELIVYDPVVESVEISFCSKVTSKPIPVLLVRDDQRKKLPAHYGRIDKPLEPESVLEWIEAHWTPQDALRYA